MLLRMGNQLLFVTDEIMKRHEFEISAVILYEAKKVGMCVKGASE